MAAPADVRLLQVARMLAQPNIVTHDDARAAIAAHPGAFAHAIFDEAADSDDVTSIESGRAYLDGRLTELDDLLASGVEPAIRAAFEQRLQAWT